MTFRTRSVRSNALSIITRVSLAGKGCGAAARAGAAGCRVWTGSDVWTVDTQPDANTIAVHRKTPCINFIIRTGPLEYVAMARRPTTLKSVF